MRLVSFTAKNFRSITDAYKLPLRDFAVLVGPNNEGKSNVLRAIVTALRILSRSEIYTLHRHAVRYRYGTDETFDYNWRGSVASVRSPFAMLQWEQARHRFLAVVWPPAKRGVR